MQEELQEQGLMVPWTDPTSGSYGDIPLDETAPDLLASESSSPSPSHQQQLPQQPHQQQHHQHLQRSQHPHLQHLQHPHEQLQHHQQHQQQRQQHLQDNDQQHLVNSPSVAYVQHPGTPYSGIPETEPIGHFEYANDSVPELIPHIPSEMRTGPGGGGRVDVGEVGKRGWKRRRDENEKVEEANQLNKLTNARCDVCGEGASGHYFGALVCLPCKSFFIRCTKDGRPNFSNQCGGKCDVLKGGRVRCQYCRFQKCISAGMYRKEKPEAVEPLEGQLLCKVCGDIANGVHFGVTTCEGCKKFFRRGLKENRTYTCKGSMHCSINPRMRNNCRYCRYQKCLYEGMSREAIKMGRPKKGEISYRKPPKKNGMKPMTRYDKQVVESNRSSMSSEYEDEVSTSDDVFDHMSTGQHPQLHPDHQQLSSQLHAQQQNQQQQHHHPAHHQQQLQQQQVAGGFSLGSILHECMTVQDWDQKMEMPDMHQGPQRAQSHAVEMTPSTSSGGSLSEDGRQVSPLVQQRVMSSRHQVVYQDPNQNPGSLEVIASMEFANEHELPVNRAIKVENVPLQDGPESAFTEGVVLEDMQNLQSITKAEFPTYHLQGIDPNPPYVVSEQRATSTPTGSSNLMPLSQLEPSVSSQIVAINMSSQNVVYTPHNHEPIIIRNPPPQNVNLIENHIGIEQSELESAQDNMDQSQGIDASGNGQQILTSQGIIRPAHLPHGVTSVSQGHNVGPRIVDFSNLNNAGVHQQQFYSENTGVSSASTDSSPTAETLRSRKLRGSEANYMFIPTSAQHAHASTPSPSTPASSSVFVSNAHQSLSGIRSPIAAILQQHRDAIQAGRPIQLSSEEIEELLNTVNAEHARAQRLHDNEQMIPKDQKPTIHESVVDLRRQPGEAYIVNSDQHNEAGHYNNQTPPTSAGARSYQNHSPSNQYSPLSQSMTQGQRRMYQDQTSPASDSSSHERQSYSRAYSSPGAINNNNNNNQVSHYISSPHATTPHNDSDQQGEIYDDSFNSALIRDSTLLHEINRIFLGIDNSCDTYGCNRHIENERDNAMDDATVVSCMSPDEFAPEVSHRYWHGLAPVERFASMTSEKQKIIQDVLDAFDNLQKTYVTTEPEVINKKMSHDQLEHWHHIQRRIARHVVAGQRFCRNIPGYFKLDIQDRISLGKHVGFGLMVLIASTEFYDPEFKRFKYIWNWTMPMQNPLFSYKVHLLSLGDRIHDIEVDRTEASMMCAISMTSIDCPGLVKPEIVCVVRDVLIDALKAYISAKSESTLRLKNLLSIMPQVRLMTVWYNNLMKKMSLPSEIISSKITKSHVVREAVGAENTPNFN